MTLSYLVTGAAGQLGRDMSLRIKNFADKVFPFSHSELDISDMRLVQKTISRYRPDVIINCASYNDVDGSEADWERAFMVNGIGPGNLAIASQEAGIPLVHFSTHFVFDGKKETPYTIADAPNPISRYGESKLLGEDRVRNFTKKHLIIRTGWLFGDTGGPSVSFPAKFLDWMKKKSEIFIVDDQFASPSYVPDLVEATLILLGEKAWGLYHFNNYGICSRYQWARFIAQKTGWNGTITPVSTEAFPGGASRPAFAALDVFPLKAILGSQAIPPWEESVVRYLDSRLSKGFELDKS